MSPRDARKSDTMASQYDRPPVTYPTRRSPSPPVGEGDYSGFTTRTRLPPRGQDRSADLYHSMPRRADEMHFYSRNSPTESFLPLLSDDAWGRNTPYSQGPGWDWKASSPLPPLPRPSVHDWDRPQTPPVIERENIQTRPAGPSSRSFEPSVAWRQSHGEPAPRPQFLSEANATSLTLHPVEDRGWRSVPESLPNRKFGRTGPKRDFYPDVHPEDSRQTFSHPARDAYTHPAPFRSQYDDKPQRGGSSYRPNRRGAPRPSALGNYKLRQRQASRQQRARSHASRVSRQDQDPSKSSNLWNRESPRSPGSSRGDILSSPILNKKNTRDSRGSKGPRSGVVHRLPQRFSSPPGKYRSAVESSAHMKYDTRSPSQSSRSDSRSSDGDSDSFSVGSSSHSSRSSRSRTRIAHLEATSSLQKDTDDNTRQSFPVNPDSSLESQSIIIAPELGQDLTSHDSSGISRTSQAGTNNGPPGPNYKEESKTTSRTIKGESLHSTDSQQPSGPPEPVNNRSQVDKPYQSLSRLTTEEASCDDFNELSSLSLTPMQTSQHPPGASTSVATTSHLNIHESVAALSEDELRKPSSSTTSAQGTQPPINDISTLRHPSSPSLQVSETNLEPESQRRASQLEIPSVVSPIFSSEPHSGSEPPGDVDGLAMSTNRLLPEALVLSDIQHVENSIHKEQNLEYQLRSRMDQKVMTEALRTAISARRKYDQQTREQRINPILIANLSLVEEQHERPPKSPHTTVRGIIEEVCSSARIDKHKDLRPLLAARFAERQASLSEKTQRLRAEYLTLHERWMAHCAALDSAIKAGVMEETTVTTGRTTRRSAANLGDAVRSDLEMEQIIASLGNEDLTDPNHLAVRNVATVPDMISVETGDTEYVFDDTNGMVDDPETFYDSRSGFCDWTPLEEEIFYEKYAEFPKQFGVISTFLPHKTTSQCVLYYYIHKKRLVNFRTAANSASGKRRKGPRKSGKQKSNALLADIRERDKEKPDRERNPRRRRTDILAAGDDKLSSRSNGVRPEATPEVEPKPKRRRANASAKVVSFREQEADEDGSVDTEPNRERPKKARKPRKPKLVVVESPAPSPVPETKFIDVNETLGRRKFPTSTSHWSSTDKDDFLRLLSRHGKNFKRIAASMPNKTTIQVSNYFRTRAMELNLERVAATAQSRSPSMEPAPRDPFVHGTHITSSSATAKPEEGQSNLDEDPEPLSKEVETSDMLNDVEAPSDQVVERQIWFREEFPASSHIYYRPTLESTRPQHQYMTVLHPPPTQSHPHGTIISPPPSLGPFNPHMASPILPSPFPPTSFQFNKYKHTNYPNHPQTSPVLTPEPQMPGATKPVLIRRENPYPVVPQDMSSGVSVRPSLTIESECVLSHEQEQELPAPQTSVSDNPSGSPINRMKDFLAALNQVTRNLDQTSK